MSAGGEGAPEWSRRYGEQLARELMAELGLEQARPSVIRFRGTFATLRLKRPPLLLKIGAAEGSRTVLERSLEIGAFLSDAGLPVAAPATELSPGPLRVRNSWAGLWRWEQRQPDRPNAALTGRLLNRLHEALRECPVGVSELDPIISSRRRLALIREGGQVEAAAVRFLTGRLDQSATAWEGFESELGVGRIHGDFKLSNVMTAPRGPLFLDFDEVRVGPREWDLATISRRGDDGWSREEWIAFAAGYGHDLLSQPAAEPLRELTHLGSLIFQLAPHRLSYRFERGRRLLDEWLRHPQKRCHELDWEGVFREMPGPSGARL